MDALMSLSKLQVPEALARACAGVPGFAASMNLVRLARWWNVWIGGSVLVVSAVVVGMSLLLLRAAGGGGLTLRRAALIGFSLLVCLGAVVVWRVGRAMPRIVASTPVQLRPRLALAAAGNAVMMIPLLFFLALWVLDAVGAAAGPPMTLPVALTTVAALATPAVGVFANGYPWLRLGRAYDNAVAGYVSNADE